MANQTQSIVITVSQTGAQQTGQAIGGIGTAAKTSSDAVDLLKNTLKGLGAALALDRLREWSDVWTRATSLVNIFSKSQTETNLVLQRLYQISQDTRQSLEGTVKAYHQMTIAGQQLGASQDDMLKVTQLVNQAFAIQATPTNVAKAGILQLGHAFTEGVVRGRQFNSLLIEMPRVLQVAANHIDAAGGSVGKLRQMMLAGQLTSKMLFDALVAGANDLDPLFQRTGKTFQQAFTVAENAIIRYVGQLTQANAVSTEFYNVVKFLADNIDTVAKVLVAVASPFILNGILAVVDAFKSMALWAAANPFTALIGLLVAATTAAILFKDQIILVQDEGLTLGDYMSAVGQVISEVFGRVGPQQVNVFKASIIGLGQFVDDFKNKFLDLKAQITGNASGVDAGASEEDRYAQFNRLIQQKIDLENRIQEINNKPSFLRYFLTGELNDYQTKLDNTIGLLQKAQDDQKKLTSGQPDFSNVKGGVDQGDTGILGDLKARARARAEQRKKDLADELKQQQDAQKLLSQPLGQAQDFLGEKNKAAKEPKNPLDNPYKLQDAYRTLLNRIEPLAGAIEEYKKAQEILDREEANGTITAERKAQLLELVTNHYRDILDPIGKYTRELERENGYLNQNVEARQVSQKMYTIEENLRKQGVTLTQEETAELRAQIIANQELARVTQQKDAIYTSIMNNQRQYVDLLKAMKQLEGDPSIKKEDITGYAVTKGPNSELFAGTQEAIDANKKRFAEMYNYIDGLEQQGVISSQTASVARVRVFSEEQQSMLQGYSDFFGQIAQLRSADGKRGSKIAKAAAIAQATINTYTAATGAYASASAIPVVGWVLGPIAAAAAVVAGLANVQAIRNQSEGYRLGGFTGNGSIYDEAGSVHRREYVMDAATTARIGVHNLDDLRSGAAKVSGAGETQSVVPQVNVAPTQVNVAVVSSREEAMAALRSPEGEAYIVETMAKNSNTLTRISGGG